MSKEWLTYEKDGKAVHVAPRSAGPEFIFREYTSIGCEEMARAIKDYCIEQPGCVPIIESLGADEEEENELIFHTLFVGDKVLRKPCAAWFEPQKAEAIQDVYFIQAGDSGPIKIGIAQDTVSRLSNLQTASPYRLNVLARIVGGGQPLEAKLHKQFAAIRLHGEWFEPTEELLTFIKQEAQAWLG